MYSFVSFVIIYNERENMTSQKKKFVIVDAMALAYKAYFAFINNPLRTKDGEPTSAVFGFINQLFKIIEDTSPDYLAIAFDSKEKTFRHDMYEKYKSSRAKMPDDMIPQMKRLKEVIEAFNIPLYILPKYEADDIIGTAVKIGEEKGFECFAVTPDKDYVQLITKNTKMIKPGRSNEEINILDEDFVRENYEFEPSQMIDYLALVGDSSDDIPGVAGVGPKTATPLIKEYKSVENLYDNLDKITKKGLHKKLSENKDNAILSKKLATINTEVPLEFDFNEAEFKKPDFDKLNKIFAELEFKNFGSRMLKVYNASENEVEQVQSSDEFDPKKADYKLVNSEKDVKELADKLSKVELFIFDTETDSLDAYNANIAGISFSIKAREAFFIPLNPFTNDNDIFAGNMDDRISIDVFKKYFNKIFSNSKIKKVCQNGKYDIAVLQNYDIKVNGFYFDTMLASYLINPDDKHSMDELSEKYLNYRPIPISEILEDKKDAEKIFNVPIKKLNDYASEDSDITFRLFNKLKDEIKKNNLDELAYEVEFPLVEVLEDMERTGIRLDRSSLKNLSKELQLHIDNYTTEIFNAAGSEFNINSPKQMQKVLFEDLGLKPTRKTKTGYSTNAQALESLKGEHEIIDHILNYRQFTKLKSTYVDALPKLISKKTNRIHTTYNQSAVSTGRLSSINPNLQNIPIRTEAGKEIRKAFVARNEDYQIFSADYSQIELRIMASICEDPYLINAFNNNEDIHKSTAAQVFQIPKEEVTSDMRRKAKEVNFGLLYGIGAFGLKTRLGITQKHAKEIIDTYFNTFTKVKSYMDESVEIAKQNGFAKTLMNRRRYLPNITSKNRVVRQFEERVAINMPIQGTAADIIKIAMVKIFRELNKRKVKSKMLLQVHDELIFDLHKDEIDELKALIIDTMENAFKLKVPLSVDSGLGENWLDAH